MPSQPKKHERKESLPSPFDLIPTTETSGDVAADDSGQGGGQRGQKHATLV
ncbi:hypothetical protein V6Z11_A13G186500 [Gossypium hirsutum]